VAFHLERVPNMPNRRPGTLSQRRALLDDATRVVQAHYAQDLSLDDVARRIATSRRQLQRIYNEIGGTTFRDQLTKVRMDKAAELLSQNHSTIRDVAHMVGYRQPAQFAKAFRARHGVSPSEYRRGGA
jgi:AraC family transcriptional regulator, regulatory protein of adaptative response / methylphosphotriester-DNA alkyltransferase methyltransferase